jgi:Homeodomain-like domain
MDLAISALPSEADIRLAFSGCARNKLGCEHLPECRIFLTPSEVGTTRHEVSCIREGRDYPDGRAIASAGQGTLDKLRIPRATFYRWYDRYREGGPEALGDHRSRPDRVWNRIPDNVRRQIIDLALDLPELSPRELAVRLALHRGLEALCHHVRR